MLKVNIKQYTINSKSIQKLRQMSDEINAKSSMAKQRQKLP